MKITLVAQGRSRRQAGHVRHQGHHRPCRPLTFAVRPDEREGAGAKDERGVALVMVLGAIAILTVMLAEFQDETTRRALRGARRARRAPGRVPGAERVNLSRLLIATEPTIRQRSDLLLMKQTPPQLPVWEFSDRLLGAVQRQGGVARTSRRSRASTCRRARTSASRAASFELTIVDEDSKINVNLAARGDDIAQHPPRRRQLIGADRRGDQYYADLRAARPRRAVHRSRRRLRRIIDWADADERPLQLRSRVSARRLERRRRGQLLPAPPDALWRKNAPYDSLEELHLVRGVERRLLGDVRRSRARRTRRSASSPCGGRARST